uniref:Integrase catalytic domain-containing protein n=1 Tax=Fagus sylvatica TaxID=28930 RepID=A0A2N9J0D9_FAGSY
MASANSSLNIPSNQSPLLLLNNMSNLMSTKLDSSNFMIWKLQITAVLDAYSMLDHLDGSIPKPDQFLTAETGIQAVNPEFLVWSKKDKALLSLLYSTCSSSVLAMVVGKSSSQEVWNTLEERFTSTARSSVLNLKLELQSIKKSGNESVSSYLQRIKSVRDKLSAVGVHSDQEELTHVILKGLPKEYAPFASAIRTRDTVLSLERLTVLLQTEEQSMNEITDSLPNSALAMFVSHNKPHFNGNQGSNRGRGRNSYSRGRGRNSSFNQSFSSPNPSSQYVPQYQQQQQISSTTQSPQATYQGKNERPTCQICWKMGHYAIDCYNRMNFAYQGKNPTTKLAAMASASNLHYTQGAETWLTDTGATDHITANANNLSPQAPYQGQEQVSVGNGQNLPIQNIGNSQLHTKYHKFQLRNVLHVPKIASNLLSVHKLCLDNNCSCYFDAKKLLIQDLPTGRLLYKGQSSNGVYPIQSHLFHSIANKTACVAHSISSDKWHLWHSRLGHPSSNVLHNIFPCFSTVPNSKSVIEHCHHCLAGKMHQLPFPISNKTVTSPFELIHADLWGPAPTPFKVFTQFRAMIETQFSLPIKILRTDCGGEFLSTPFNQFCSSKGIIHQLSCPHTPQQNGVAERKHRHLVQCALALLSQSKLPLSYWSYAISTAAHIINKLPTPNLGNQSPWDALYQVAPDLSHLRTFGCECFPLLTPYNSHKLLPKTTPCVFLGYPLHTKGYYCLDPITHRLYTSRHVLFNETVFPGLSHPKVCSPTLSTSSNINSWLNILQLQHSCSHNPVLPFSPGSSQLSTGFCPNTTDHVSAPATDLISPLNRSTETHIFPLVFVQLLLEQKNGKNGIVKPKLTYAALVDYTLTEPPSYTVASKHSKWCTAMDEEFQALQQQATWTLVPLPDSKNVVGCKWVYKLKHHSDGSIARYKARLVAKGFHQQYGVDFEETFSPVIKPPTVRLVLSLAVSLNWPLRQLDVKNAFLHGTLKEEEVYMTQPQGYIDPTHSDYVCKLQKSIYGLKQAPRAWFESFTTQLLHLGFIASSADSSLFIYKDNQVIAYLLLYVDDIVLTSNTPSFLDHLIHQLNSIFDLKDLGSLHYFLGLQITSCPNVRLSVHDGDLLPDPHAYRSMVGALHYLTFTRPDISFAVHQVCQYMSAPTTTHLAAAKRVLQYIRGTFNHDADWAGDPDDRRSTSGFLVYLGNNAITWSAKKQPTVSRSSTESEYRALAIASAETCWVRSLLQDLGIYLTDPPILWCDNVSALAIASNPVFHARTKHIEVDFHFVRERVLRKDLVVKFVSTVDQLADIFTKSLPTHRFLELRRNLTVSVPKIEGG